MSRDADVAATPSARDPFADDVLERLIRSNQDYQREHGHYIVPLAERLLAARKEIAATARVVHAARVYQLERAGGVPEAYRLDLFVVEPDTATRSRSLVSAGEKSSAAHVFDFREIADYVVEHDDTATAANALRSAQDEIDRLREQINSGRTHREALEGLPEGTLPRV